MSMHVDTATGRSAPFPPDRLEVRWPRSLACARGTLPAPADRGSVIGIRRR